MTHEEIKTKLSLYWGAGNDLRLAKSELAYAQVAVRAHEQEIAERFLTTESLEWLNRDQLYLIGRQIAKALPNPIG
jgi:hypothetical protein